MTSKLSILLNVTAFLQFCFECTSLESLLFQYTNEQQLDQSCGLAVTSTMLEHYWGVDAPEPELYEELYGVRATDETWEGRVSLANMMALMEARGVLSRAFTMNAAELESNLASFYPIIVHYDYPEDHFALVLARRPGFWLVSDPARGTRWLSDSEFDSYWSGVAAVTASRQQSLDTVQHTKVVDDQQKRLDHLERLAHF